MSEVDLPRRLTEYGAWNWDIKRVAILPEDHHLPSFSAHDKGPRGNKRGDTRYPWYLKTHGERCWELDALDPRTLRERIRDAVVEELDMDAWERALDIEQVEVESMRAFLDAWDESAE
jgi:hypothetical protein